MKKEKIFKIIVLAIACILLFSVCSVSILAATLPEPLQNNEVDLDKTEGKDLKMSERVEYALQGTVTGLLMVFAVLALLWLVVSFSKVIFYDLPRKARESAKSEAEAQNKAETESAYIPQAAAPAETGDNDGELIAVITAAVAAAIESGEYGNEFSSGFRVVSFKRANTDRWNKR